MNVAELFSDIPELLNKNPQYLVGIPWELLESLPVIESKQYSNLVFEDGKYRVFISRSPIGDSEVKCSAKASAEKDRLVFIDKLNDRKDWVRVAVRVCDGLHDGFNRYRLQIQAKEAFG